MVGNFIDQRRAEQAKIATKHNMKLEFENIVKNGNKNASDKAITMVDKQFDTGKYTLTKEGLSYYTALAQTYKEGSKKLLIVGHTDDVGKADANQILSQKRAKAVGEIFAKNSVNMSNIYYQGAGATKPRADNHTEDGRANNRRVEIVELASESDIALFAAQNDANPAFFRTTEQSYSKAENPTLRLLEKLKKLLFKAQKI